MLDRKMTVCLNYCIQDPRSLNKIYNNMLVHFHLVFQHCVIKVSLTFISIKQNLSDNGFTVAETDHQSVLESYQNDALLHSGHEP